MNESDFIYSLTVEQRKTYHTLKVCMQSKMQTLAKTMIDNATLLREGTGFARSDLQSGREASAHAMEFWAGQILEKLEL
jgi:hypothetical protein